MALVVIGVTVGGKTTAGENSPQASTASSEQAAAAAQTVSTVAPSHTLGEPLTTASEETTTTEEQITTTTVAVGGWGETAEVEGLRITVDKPFTNSDLQVMDALQVDENLRVLMIKITIENAGNDVADYDPSEFKLYDTAGAGPYPGNALEAKLAPDMPGLEPSGAPGGEFGVDLDPGKTAVGYLAYIVPRSAGASRLEYDAFSSLVGAEAVWNWRSAGFSGSGTLPCAGTKD
jgi:hypothetical protein